MQVTFSKKSRIWTASNPDHLTKCGAILKKGNLVAFPTETVYGLGADALNKDAVLKIFLTKKRPLTDPIIVHIDKIEKAAQFHNLNEVEQGFFDQLSAKFMPGPLTVVGRAREDIPKELCANTGFVGVRFPKHEVALALITASGTSVAAPSANLFGHVSPTQAQHVMSDFKDSDIDILDGGSTAFGIESTVVKLSSDTEGEVIILEILRLGSISFKMLDDFVYEYNEKLMSSESGAFQVQLIKKRRVVPESENAEGPGQFLKHYSPNKDCFMLKSFTGGSVVASMFENALDLSKGIVLDFAGSYKFLEKSVAAYRDLSTKGDIKEAMRDYYALLRELETVADTDYILVADLNQQYSSVTANEDFLDSLQDKIFRSSAGHFVICSSDKESPQIARI